MEDAFGGLKWSRADFWGATLTEYFCAVGGHNKHNGAPEKEDGPSDAELDALVAKYG